MHPVLFCKQFARLLKILPCRSPISFEILFTFQKCYFLSDYGAGVLLLLWRYAVDNQKALRSQHFCAAITGIKGRCLAAGRTYRDLPPRLRFT